jgi:hypothetical protein
MPVDRRLFRSADEAIAFHRGALTREDANEIYPGRVWKAFHEANPGLNPDAVERAIEQHWDELEGMHPEQAMALLAERAGGRPRVDARPQPPPEKDLFDPNTELSISDIIAKRRESRRFISAARGGRRTE